MSHNKIDFAELRANRREQSGAMVVEEALGSVGLADGIVDVTELPRGNHSEICRVT